MAGSCLEVFVMAITLIFSAPSESKPTQDPPALPCEAPCWCDGLSLMNCSSSGISTLPMTIPESVTVLDLTHNNIMSLSLPDSESGIDKLKHLRLGYNKISHLSLCVVPGLPVTNPGYTPLPGFSKRFGNGVRSACASNLELLSVERNHLKNIPKGLGHLRSLQVIQLSHNRISAVHMEDLQNCNKLSAIYLQHNQITTIDPLAFQDLRELKVLNLSNNALTTIQPTVFVSLSNLQLELDVTNNNWICDCDLLDVKKWITVLSEGRQQSWCIVCKEPSQLSSQDLRNLEDFELSGETSVHQTSLSQEVAAYVGKKLVLPCSGNQKQDSDLLYWWTPHGQISKNSKGHFKLNNIGSLVINDVQESDGGLYVCIFGEIQTRISVLDIRIQENNPVKLVRKSRGADFLTRQGRTHSDFVLAVCLSVIITFICAFALGVVARPFLDHLWKKIHPQKSATGHIYENEGFAEERETGGRKEQTMHDEIHIPVINEDASDSRPQPNTPHYVTIHPVLPSSENQQDSSLESSNYQQALQKESRDGNPDLESVNTEDVLNVSSSQLPASSEKSQHFKEVHDNRSGNIKDDFHTQHESKEISNASQHGVSLENDTPSETANEIHPVLNDNLQDDPQNHQINHFDSDVIMEPPNCKEEKEHSAFSITKPDMQHNREDTAITVSKQVNVPNLSQLGRELEVHLFKEAEEEDVDFKFSDLRSKNGPWEASKTDPKGSDEVLPTQQDTKQNMNFSEAFAVHPEVLTDQNTSDECENESCKSQKQEQHFLNASHLTKEEDSPSNYKENEYERVLSKEQLTIEGKPSQNDRMEDNRLITANAEDVTQEEDVDQQKGFFNPDDDSHSNPPSEFGNDSGDSFEFSDSFNDTEYGNLLDFNLAQQLKTEAWPPFGESTSCILNPNQTLLDLQDNLDGSAEKPNHSLLQAPSNNVLSPKGVEDVNQLDTMFPELDYERYDYTTGSKVDHSEQQVSNETTLENVLINQEALDVYSPVPVYNRDTDTSVEQWPDKDDKSSKEFEIPVSSTGFSADDWIVFDNPGFAESDWSTTWKSLPQSPVVQSNTDVVEDQETFVPSDIAGNSDIQTSQIQNEDDILTNSSPVTETDLRTEDDHATKLLAIQPFKSSKTELFPTQPCDWLLTIEPSANPRDNSTTKHLHDKHSVMPAEDETESEKKLPHSKQKLDWAKGGFFVQKKKVIDNFTPAFHPSLKPIVKTSSPSKEYTESITTQVANMTFTSLVKKNEDTPAHTNTFLTDAYSPELSSETVLSTVRYTEQNKVPVFNEGSNETVKYQDSSSKENISTDNEQYHAGEQGCRIYNPMTDYPITVGDEAFAENLTATRTKTTENSNVTFVLESSNDEGSEV